ncbi:hypothetical protein D9M72_374800 [compost metagenome]
MVLVHEAGQANDRAAGIGPPVRREEAGERRHDVDAAVVLDRGRERLHLRGAADQAEVVPQPLDQGSGDGDRAFQRVVRSSVPQLVAHGGQQAVLGVDNFLAGVEDQEAARSVRVLGFAGIKCRLAERGCLLVAEDAGNRHFPEQLGGVDGAVDLGGRLDGGHH